MENNLSPDMSESHNVTRETSVSLMDIWLLIRKQRGFVLSSIIIISILGGVLAFLLPSIYSFTTAIEIGNQVVNDEIVAIEATETVIDKLNTGYIPLVKRQFIANNPNGDDEYLMEVSGSDKSQIVQILSHGKSSRREYIFKLHTLIVNEIITDHNRTVDAMKANAQILLSEAEQKLGEVISKEQALILQLDSIRISLDSLQDYIEQLNNRINEAELEINKIKPSEKYSANDDIKLLMLTNQIGEWRSNLLEVESSSKVDIFVIRADAEKELNNVENEKQTYLNEIRYRQTTLENIQTTRSLGQIAVMSLKPTDPNRLVIIFASIIISLIFSVAGALIIDFVKRSNKLTN